MRAFVVLCVAAWVGCSDGPTTVLVRIGAGAAGPTPASLTVEVFDPTGKIATADLASPLLPGTLVVRGLPDTEQLVTVEVRSGAFFGSGQVHTRAHAQVVLELALGDVVSPDGGADGGGDDGGMVVPSGLSLCATAGLAFCDGFESGQVEAHWNDNRQVGAATMSVDATRAYRGSHALRLHHDAMAANEITQIGVGETGTFPAKDFFVRAFVYRPSPTGDEENLLYARQTQGSFNAVDVGADKDGKIVTFNNIGGQGLVTNSTTSLPTGRWVCLEWAVSARALGSMHLWIDGVEAGGISGTQNLLDVPAISSVQLTMVTYKPTMAQPARDIWFDEVAVDYARIGCDR